MPKVTKKSVTITMPLEVYKAVEAAAHEAEREPEQEIMFRVKQSFVGEVDMRPSWERSPEAAE